MHANIYACTCTYMYKLLRSRARVLLNLRIYILVYSDILYNNKRNTTYSNENGSYHL